MHKTDRVANLTVDELRAIIREEIERATRIAPQVADRTLVTSDLSDFPQDDLGSWPEGITLRREEIYDDDGR